MVLSITICTFNRVIYLQKCLNSILEQTKGNRNIEINVIDNNSTDKTREFINTLQSTKPEINYYIEKQQGISYARNLSFAVCKGDFLAFVDDDAVINKNWLTSLLKELDKKNHNIVYGGPIYPKFEIEPDRWIDKNYFIRKFRNGDGFLNHIQSKEGFSGGNMCISKKLFLNSDQFNTEIGMNGGTLGLGEEPDFFYKLIKKKSDVKLYNISNMSITHNEASYKLDRDYLKERIILNAYQFTKRTIFHENILLTFFILFVKILIQLIKVTISSIIRFFIPKYKFRSLRSYWIIQGIIKAIF